MTGDGPSRDRLTRRGVAAYQGALEAVLAIAIGSGIGYWADERLETSPRWLIVGTILGFGAFVLRLWRLRKLVEGDPPQGGAGRGG